MPGISKKGLAGAVPKKTDEEQISGQAWLMMLPVTAVIVMSRARTGNATV